MLWWLLIIPLILRWLRDRHSCVSSNPRWHHSHFCYWLCHLFRHRLPHSHHRLSPHHGLSPHHRLASHHWLSSHLRRHSLLLHWLAHLLWVELLWRHHGSGAIIHDLWGSCTRRISSIVHILLLQFLLEIDAWIILIKHVACLLLRLVVIVAHEALCVISLVFAIPVLFLLLCLGHCFSVILHGLFGLADHKTHEDTAACEAQHRHEDDSYNGT